MAHAGHIFDLYFRVSFSECTGAGVPLIDAVSPFRNAAAVSKDRGMKLAPKYECAAIFWYETFALLL